MKTIIDFQQAIGWEVTLGYFVLLAGAVIFFFSDLSETKKEKAKRLARDAARKDAH